MENTDTYTLVDEDATINKTGQSLSDYLGSKTIDEAYTKIIVPSTTGNPDDGLVYFYLNLDAAYATQYFLDYYDADSDKLARYTEFYTDGIQAVGDNTRIYTAGTYVEYKSGDLSSLSYSVGTDSVNGSISNLPDEYEALTTKLITDYSALTADEIGNTVFYNIIQTDETSAGAGDGLKTFLSNCIGLEYTVSVTASDGSTVTAVLIDNANSSAYNPAYDANIAYSQDNSYLIIATGDVTIRESFTGTILANGIVTVGTEGDTNITMESMSTENVKKLLSQECDNGTVSLYLYEFFKDGSVYISSGFSSGSVTSSVSGNTTAVALADLISYQNWKKK